MEQAVEYENFDLGCERMVLLDGLFARGRHRDGQIAGDLFGANALGGKGEHIGSFVFAAELAVEAADGGVAGEQDRDFTFEADGGLGFGQKTGQSARGGQAEIPR
jgi:hypothetical protein